MGIFNPNEVPKVNVGWLVKDYIPFGGYCLFAAQPGVGKSYLLEALAVDVVCGGKFLGQDTVAGDVLLIDEDSYAPVVESRLRMFFRQYPSYSPEKGHRLFHFVREGYCMTGGNTASLKSLIQRPEHKNVKLIILDSLRGLASGKSNLDNTKEASTVVEFLQEIGKNDVTVAVVHHISTKSNLSVNDAMTRDNPDGLIMNNTALVSASQAVFIVASPNRGEKLEELCIRPVSRRVMLPKPFSAKLHEDGDMMLFYLNGAMSTVDDNALSRWDKRLLGHFKPGVEQTVKSIVDSLEDALHPNTVRNRLEVLEDKGYVEVVAQRGFGGAHHYVLTELGSKLLSVGNNKSQKMEGA